MAAYEDDDDDYFVVDAASEGDGSDVFVIQDDDDDDDGDGYINVFTAIVPPSTPSLDAATSSSPPAPYVHPVEQIRPPSPPTCSGAASTLHGEALQQEQGPDPVVEAARVAAAVDAAVLAAAQAMIYPLAAPAMIYPLAAPAMIYQNTVPKENLFLHRNIRGESDVVDDDEEVTEDEDDDDEYQEYYDLAFRGRARHLKRSSGRRGRTKKASTMGRSRAEGRMAQYSCNL